MSADLKSLRDIISSSIDIILDTCEKTGKEFPSLDQPIHPSEFSPEGIRNDSNVQDAIGLIVAAASQLIATVQSPPATLTISTFKFTLSAALGIAEAANIAEIIRPVGSKGMHVNDIAAKSNTDPKKLSRVLRYLATNHWFREVNPDIFAHNLLSSLLDTGKEVADAFTETKHENSPGFSALVGYGRPGYLREVITEPETAFSEEPNHSAVQRALDVDLPLWDYFDTPEGQYRRKRFAIMMSASNKLQPPEAILTSYDWETLPKGGVIVDVGGGLGHVSLEVAKSYPDVQIAIEDRPLILDQAKQYWKENLPSHVSEGKVHFIDTDFFEAQPTLPGNPEVFLLRMIVHDWSDKYVIKLLRRLRDVAKPSTKLVIVDSVLDYACASSGGGPPAPLLSNMGGGNLLAYSVDLAVFGVLNSGERTASGFQYVLSASGWELKEIRRNPVNKIWWPSIIAVPSQSGKRLNPG
ncbi:S-adenosyl-L-methionine-dependent methyltransferase [Phellopilus nigrolimitatus]|nr:S-adenosyl-L-methionine-dependent methyltransferase [Phellopilus nigrolimitatus]